MKPDREVNSCIKEIERLLYARRTFSGCVYACKFVHDSVPDQTGEVYHTLSAGLIVSYARPFMDAEGLGPLHQKYSKFDGEPFLGEYHKAVMAARNSIYAHFSPIEAGRLVRRSPASGLGQGKKPKLTIRNGKVDSVGVPTVGYAATSLANLQQLCVFQVHRLIKDTIGLLEHLRGSDQYEDGDYELGVSFPKSKLANP
jgi:hypothetical protein